VSENVHFDLFFKKHSIKNNTYNYLSNGLSFFVFELKIVTKPLTYFLNSIAKNQS